MSESIIWFTGLPGSGKSTLARRVQAHFVATGRPSVLLDGDEFCDVLGPRPRALHSLDERDRFYRALAALAAMLANQGNVVLVAATAPRRQDRARARAGVMAAGTFIEVWIKTPFSECQARDLKGVYAQARRDDAQELGSVGAAYEPPLAPEVIADGGLDDTAVIAIESLLDCWRAA